MVQTACSSALVAISRSVQLLKSDLCDACLRSIFHLSYFHISSFYIWNLNVFDMWIGDWMMVHVFISMCDCHGSRCQICKRECIQTCRRIYRITIYNQGRRYSGSLNPKTLRTMHSAVVHPSHLMHLSLLWMVWFGHQMECLDSALDDSNLLNENSWLVVFPQLFFWLLLPKVCRPYAEARAFQ